jgi:hypothetical protein
MGWQLANYGFRFTALERILDMRKPLLFGVQQ